MHSYRQYIHFVILFVIITGVFTSCRKLVSIDEPRDTLSSQKMFLTDPQAKSALIGLYGNMIHGRSNVSSVFLNSFAAGLATYAGGLSSGEIRRSSTVSTKLYRINSEFALDIWTSAYNIIYLGNSVIDGIAASTSVSLSDKARKQYTAEAKVLRAFSYFYLVNYFGDVPLVLTVDFQQTKSMKRTPQSEVYQQIQQDLEDAYNNLPGDYAESQGKRGRVNKWVAAALLARVHLYLKQYDQAATYATEVINQTALYQLETLPRVFLTGSKEAIFQLMQTNTDNTLKNATAEGYKFLPNPLNTGTVNEVISNELLQIFEPNDGRKSNWIGFSSQTKNQTPEPAWYPFKYKVGIENSVLGAPSLEYYMVIRLAELYLIRAEARSNGAQGGAGAVEDLNMIRRRAELPDLSLTLNSDEVKEAVWKERQVELFAEWGHRWMDLKRSGKASAVLSAMPGYQPWDGDWQLLYPIPDSEILINRNLVPNPGYNQIN